MDCTTSKKNKMQMNHRATTTTTKPYCRACHNAGKPIDEYTSHWTRSSPGSGGVITCPLILSSECGYCHQTGHWTKFCPVLAEREEAYEVQEVVQEVVQEDDSVKPDFSKSKKVLNWKTALGVKEVEVGDGGAVGGGGNSTIILNWKKALGMSGVDAECVLLPPPPPPTSTLKMSKEEFKRIFCNFKRYENWADADSDLDDDDDMPVGSLAV